MADLQMSPIQIGMNGRFYPTNKQTARDEIVFASMTGFRCIQFPGMTTGLSVQRVGDPLEVVGLALRRAGITAVMQIMLPVFGNGLTVDGETPMDILQANLQAIRALGCTHVHWHLVPIVRMLADELRALEKRIIPQMKEAVALANTERFVFGFKHNSPDVPLFCHPESCAELLTAVAGLGFVWDFNHTAPDDLAGYAALASQVTLLHVSDTPWPDTNHHLPLGQGNLDFSQFLLPLAAAKFSGFAVLEIGGLPKSGGYGRDTNEALMTSFAQLSQQISACLPF